MENIIMAWRNLWRNRRRTLITTASIFFGVLFSTIMTSMQEGTYTRMIDNVVKFYTGYIQIQDPAYWDKKSVNNTFIPGDTLFDMLDNTDHIAVYAQRLESFSLISTGDYTTGGALIGIQPEDENRLTGLKKWVSEGSYLEDGDNGIMLTSKLARRLEVELGDTLILLGQGFHGVTAEGLFPLTGIIEFPSPQLNNMGGYVTLEKARDFYWAGGRATSLVLMLDNYNQIRTVTKKIRSFAAGQYHVMTWDEMQPQLKQMIQADRAGAFVMKVILYMVIGFGIFGTIIMMLSERKKELGIMMAVGMKKIRLISMVTFETVYIGIIGVLSGFVISIPVILFFIKNPIRLPAEAAELYEYFGIEPFFYFSSQPGVFLTQVVIVFLITLVVAVYPFIKIINLNAVNAIRY